jgi:hypothetical protein
MFTAGIVEALEGAGDPAVFCVSAQYAGLIMPHQKDPRPLEAAINPSGPALLFSRPADHASCKGRIVWTNLVAKAPDPRHWSFC